MLRNKMNGMMEGWVDTILKYNFTPQYLPGDKNNLADALSRSHSTVIDVRTVGVLPELSSLNISQSLLMEAEQRGKIIPDKEKRSQLIKDEHQRGHFSVESMFRQLWKKNYWWPFIQDDL